MIPGLMSSIMLGKLNAGPPATISYEGNRAATANASSYSLTSVIIGEESSERHVVIVAVIHQNAATGFTSVTVGGQSCTELVTQASSGASAKTRVGIFITDDPVATGTSVTVVVTANGTCYNCGVGAYRLISDTTVPTDVDGSADSDDMTLTVKKEGVCVSITGYQQSSAFLTWSGLTEDFDTVVEGGGWMVFSGASDSFIASDELTIGTVTGSPTYARAAATFR